MDAEAALRGRGCRLDAVSQHCVWAGLDDLTPRLLPGTPLLRSCRRATESATQRTGATIVPLYLSLDPRKDTPADLKRVAQAAGHPAFAALTGDADGASSTGVWWLLLLAAVPASAARTLLAPSELCTPTPTMRCRCWSAHTSSRASRRRRC